MLDKLAVTSREVKLPAQLEGLDGLIIPGGESTTMARLMDVYRLRAPLKQRVEQGIAVWGTCAGTILLANRLAEDRPEPLGLMDVEVHRNAYGRQVDSFETDVPFAVLGDPVFHCVFIRAPKISATGADVEVVGSAPSGGIIAARQRHVLATTFHPELTGDTRFHRYFLEIVRERES